MTAPLSYSITAQTIARAFAKLGRPGCARVRFVNGEVHEAVIPLHRLRDWAKGTDKLTLQIIAGYRRDRASYHLTRSTWQDAQVSVTEPVTAFKFTRDGNSAVIFYGHAPEGRELARVPPRLRGEILTLTAPESGGEFTLQN